MRDFYYTVKILSALAVLKVCRVKFKNGRNCKFFNKMFEITAC